MGKNSTEFNFKIYKFSFPELSLKILIAKIFASKGISKGESKLAGIGFDADKKKKILREKKILLNGNLKKKFYWGKKIFYYHSRRTRKFLENS
jgi:hypothetical protein